MDDAALSKMKVADLKKELKNRGLPVTGNKTELVERLQLALEGGENAAIAEGEGGEEEFDEEDILGGEEGMEEEITPQEEEAALGGIRLKDPSALLAQPEKKKISLKRSEPPQPTPVTKEEEEKKEEEGGEKKEGEEDEAEEKDEGKENDGEAPKKLIKLDVEGEKNRLETRAERFGVPMTEEAKKASRAERFGVANGAAKGGRPAKLSMETGGIDLDRLKARAERFGEVTSKSLSKLSEQEKRKQREARFGAPANDKPKAEGNTLITSLSSTKSASATTKEQDEVLKKRAERFAIK